MSDSQHGNRVAMPVSRQAFDRYTDLMRQGFMKCSSVPPHTAAQRQDASEQAARILARLEATEYRVLTIPLVERIAWHQDMIARTTHPDTLAYLQRSLARLELRK